MNSRNRRILSVAGSVAAIALLVGYLFVGSGKDSPDAADYDGLYLDNTSVLGDADGDGRLSDGERSDLNATQQSVKTLRTKGVLPTKGIGTLLVTPAGDRWWRLVTGLSTQTALWKAPAPSDQVRWYAYTEGRAYHPYEGPSRPYDAIHVAFKDQASAMEWARSLAANGQMAASVPDYRDGIVTITPPWVDIRKEPFAKSVAADTLADIDVKIAMWQIDFGSQVELRADEAVTPKAYHDLFANLGFGGKATWTATSAAPDAVWRGPVDGFQPDKVDVPAAIAAINTSPSECTAKSLNGCADGKGISEAVNYLWASDADGSGGGETTLMSEYVAEDSVVAVVTGSGFRGAVTGTLQFNKSPISQIGMWVSKDGVLSVHPMLIDTAPPVTAPPSVDGSADVQEDK